MLYLLGVLGAIIGLAVSIGLHEMGHMVPAKRFGVRVPQYMLGFGPTLWSRRRGETEYGVKAIPLGGYVKLIGMYPPPQGAVAGAAAKGLSGRFRELSEEARIASWKEVGPGDDGRLFYRLSVPKKVIVMLSGPMMNLLIAVAMFSLLLVGIGVATASTAVATVYPCVPPAMASEEAARAALADPAGAQQGCAEDSTPSPAAQAGLVAGDRITSIDGVPVTEWRDLTETTRANPGSLVILGVSTATGDRTVEVELATAYRPGVDDSGAVTNEIVQSGYLGVSPTVEYVSQPWSSVPSTMWEVAVLSGKALLTLPVRIYELAADMIAGEERDLDSPVSVVGVSRLSGEVAAADESMRDKLAVWVALMASLNLFVFLFNLLPLLPLDGGHVAGALWEGLRRQVARVRGAPDPGPVDVSRALPVTYAVASLLILLSSVVIIADVVNPISIYG